MMRTRHAQRIYSPAPLLATPGRLFSAMCGDLWQARELAWRLALRDLKAQYRQSALGYLWAFLPPLLIAACFVVLRARNVVSVPDTGLPYAAFVTIGALLWQSFADAVTTPLRMFVASRSMLVKVNFPREALVVGGVIVTLFGVLVRLVIVGAALLYAQVPPHGGMLLAIPGVLALVLAGTCVGLLLVPFAVLYKDVENAVGPLLVLWMLMSPVAYPMPAGAQFNFVAPLLEFTRSALIADAPQAVAGFVFVTLLAGVVLLAGWVLLRLATPHVVARLGM